MRLLLDTHILLAIVNRQTAQLAEPIRNAVRSLEHDVFASAASFWEIAIKSRLGKLAPDLPPGRLPDFFKSMGISLLSVNHIHAVTAALPHPPTRDPFDRLLLSQCLVEDLRLATLDRALAAHPLAWRAG